MLNKADSNLNFPKPKTEIFNDDEIAKFPRGETLTLTKGEAQKKNDQEKIILKIQRVKTEIEKLNKLIQEKINIKDFGAAQSFSRILHERYLELSKLELNNQIEELKIRMNEYVSWGDFGAAQNLGRILKAKEQELAKLNNNLINA